MKKILIFICLAIVSLPLCAQTLAPLSDDDAAKAIERINAAATGMKTMQCDFTQVKTLKMLAKDIVATGALKYEQPSRLRWEYATPQRYLFVLNGKTVTIRSGAKTDVIDVEQNKIFQQIATIMLNSVTGKSLTDKSSFDTKMFKHARGAWVAKLFPRRKELRQVFAEIHISFDPQSLLPIEVRMIDRKGDATVITLKNMRKNEPISAHSFTAD